MDERAQLGSDNAVAVSNAPPAEPVAELVSPPRAHGPSGWRRAGSVLIRAFALATSIAVLSAMGYGWWNFGDLDDNTVTTDVISPDVAAGGPEPLDGAVDLLLVGMDSRTDAFGNPLPKEVLELLNGGKVDGERNTDTMILVHIPVDGRRAVAFSFPRDSWVDIGEGFGKRKLNSAFVYAYNDARKTLGEQGVTDKKELDTRATVAGRKNLISTIERLVGNAVTIERYAEVNLASFYEVTKAIGGVEVCLRNAVDEEKSGANFRAGRQTISGKEALSFVRQRYELPNGDLDRIVRQQVFLAALADKVLSADMLTNPSRARDLLSAVQRSVVLSKGWNLSRFAAQMQGLSSGNIEFRTIPTQGDAKIGGADVIKVDPLQVQEFVAEFVGEANEKASTSRPPSTTTKPTSSRPGSTTDPLPEGTGVSTSAASGIKAITVDVRNGSNTLGLASTVLDSLTGLGFVRGQTGDASVQNPSVVRYATGELAGAQRVAKSLGGVFTFEEDRALSARHVRVVLGTSYKPGKTTAVNGPASLAGETLLQLEPTPTGPSTAPTTSTPSTAPPTKIDAGGSACVN
ncbi:MAG: LCP family protein [Actinomycetota bacterium]|nr:LCP family protein [Actinomycetota bacterium]